LIGSGVAVHLSEGVTVTFEEVTSDGITTMSESGTGPEPPTGFDPVPASAPVYCDLGTSAAYTGQIELRMEYDEGDVAGIETRLTLQHYTGSIWEDVTTSVDTDSNIVRCTTSSFSSFMLFERLTCCVGKVGDVDGLYGDIPTIADISAIIDNLFGSGEALDCYTEADTDLSGGVDPVPEDIAVGDISAIIDNLFGSGGSLPDCL